MYSDARFKFDSFLTGFCIFAATIKLASRGESSTYSLKTYVTGKLKPLNLTNFRFTNAKDATLFSFALNVCYTYQEVGRHIISMGLLETTNISTVDQKSYLNKNLGNQALFSDEESSYL